MAGYAYQREGASLRFSLYRKALRELSPEQRQSLRDNPADRDYLRAMVEQRLVQTSIKKQNTFGRVVLDSIWRIYINGWHQLHLGEHDTLLEWAVENLLYDDDGEELSSEKHLQAMVRIVERVFSPINAAHYAGEPFVTPDGEVVTPEFLIGEQGIQEKMRLLSFDFENAETHEERQDILNSILTDSKADIEAKKKVERNGNPLFTWKRVLLDENTYEYVVTVPRKLSPVVESALRQLGAQEFN